jgi:hypothetical protein
MISPIQEMTQTASSLSGHSIGITLGGWIYLGVFAAWMASIYIFALKRHKRQKKKGNACCTNRRGAL